MRFWRYCLAAVCADASWLIWTSRIYSSVRSTGAIVDLVGKGGHIRTVPVPAWVKAIVDAWIDAAELRVGKLFRCVCRAGRCWGDGITERLVWHIVKQYAAKLGSGKSRLMI